MLEYLHVKNLALIDEAEVEFKPGFNILTGETGAGKSILLGSVGLALGGKYNAGMLRTGAASGFVELTFTVENGEIEKRLAEMDIFVEDGRIVLSRKLMEGRSVSKINGESVSKGTLKDVASLLIDIYGQNEHQTLLHKKNHLAFLDLYAGGKIEKLKRDTAKFYHEHAKLKQQLEEGSMDERERLKEISLVEFEIEEIEQANLLTDEDEELEQLYRRMSEGKNLSESVEQAHRYTSEDPSGNASECLSRAIRALADVVDVDQEGAALYERLVEVDGLLNDFNRELARYGKSLEFSEEEFYETEGRLNEINRLKAKYGNTVNDILAYCEEKRQRLSRLKDYENYIEELKEKLETSAAMYEKCALSLRKKRKETAKAFVEEIRKGLVDLNFLDVRFEMRFSDTRKYTANGMDEAEFYISTNPGENVRPMGTAVSGGELSRIMLAVKTVLADKEDTPTLIFDEIDTGISGITAGKVAEAMHLIGKSRQVLCITHLAQIAALADAHFLIEKAARKNVTKTEIKILSEEDSVRELARLLGGANVTESILAGAREMKERTR